MSPATETTLSKVQKSTLMLAYEVNAVGPILVIKVKFSRLLRFSVSCSGCINTPLCFPVVHCDFTDTKWSLNSSFWSAHVAITEDWRSLRDRERICIGCKYER